ncbi:MAG: hypothetical protein ABH934_00055 [Chloroflexota bacterium]
MINRLRHYQIEVAMAILDSVFQRKGLTFSVEIARQGGKSELSAQLELLLLTLLMATPKNIIKCAPTFKPQTIISETRNRRPRNKGASDPAFHLRKVISGYHARGRWDMS